MSSQIDPAARVAMLVPQSTRDNFTAQIRRAAVARGITVKAAAQQQLKNWRDQHDADPLGGWDVLADWLEDADLAGSTDIDPADAAKVRAFESAKRDPANPQTAILDLSDAVVRDEIDAARRAAAERGITVKAAAQQQLANPQTAILDLSDAVVRDEIDAARRAAAERGSVDAPVMTDKGEEVPAGRVDAVLKGDETPRSGSTPAAASTTKK